MTGGSIKEYTEAVRGRYIRASKKEKGKILDEFTEVVGYHRKAAIRLLHRTNQVKDINGLILTKPYNNHNRACNTILLPFTSATK